MNKMPCLSISELVFGNLQALQIAPNRLTDMNSWHGHIPFAFWLVKNLKPSVFVQLGVHKGDSYSPFCQAVELFSLNTVCYGVDAWKVEDHASLNDETIYQEYSFYHNNQYASFSRLIRSTFDDALGSFEDGSVDLLHINDRHGHEEVKHNFEAWLPKLSTRAVVLFHGINVHAFGVQKLFLELSQQYLRRTFSFIHSHGLGLLIVGEKVPDCIQHLCQLKDKDATYIQLDFSILGKLVEAQPNEATIRSKIRELDFINNQLASTLLEIEEVRRVNEMIKLEIEEVRRVNEMIMRSLSMRLTKPLRDFSNLVRRLR